MSRRLLAAAAGAAAALALALVPAAGASAHDYLVGSDPAVNGTVTAPIDQVSLTFNDRVLVLAGEGSANLVTVTGPDAAKRHFETGCASVLDRVVTAPVALGAAGKYTITYQIVSADGHTVSNSLAFDYRPPAGTKEAAGTGQSACKDGKSGSEAPATTPAASGRAGGQSGGQSVSTPQPTASAGSSNLGLVIGIGVGILVLALAGVVIVLLTARRKRPAGDGTPPAE